MFVLSQSSSYTWPVSIRTAANGGKFETHSFIIEFRRLLMSQAEPLSQQLGTGDLSMPAAARDLVIGWKGICDNGVDVEFSRAALDRLLDVPFVAATIMKAWQESITGSLEKN